MKASILAALSEYATEALALATDSTTRTVLAGVISDLDAEHDRLVEDEPEQDYYPLGAAAR